MNKDKLNPDCASDSTLWVELAILTAFADRVVYLCALSALNQRTFSKASGNGANLPKKRVLNLI